MKVITTQDPHGTTQVAVEERPVHEGRVELSSTTPPGRSS